MCVRMCVRVWGSVVCLGVCGSVGGGPRCVCVDLLVVGQVVCGCAWVYYVCGSIVCVWVCCVCGSVGGGPVSSAGLYLVS